jgi:hypothetical protein
LGEINLSVEGDPSRDAVDRSLRIGFAKLGADGVFVVYDRMRILPFVYLGWWGPTGYSEETRRDIIGVAIKYK